MEQIRENERIEELGRGGLRIISGKGFRFGTDAVLLADFASHYIKPGARVADLGAGCGILPFLIGARVKNTAFDAVEINGASCALARRSAVLNGWEGRLSVHHMDLKQAPEKLGRERFDAVVSNPPYGKLGEGMLPADEAEAAARFELCCTLEDVVSAAFALLKNGGSLVLVHQARRYLEILDSVRARKFCPRHIRLVHPRAGDEGKLVLIECVKNGGGRLALMPPLILYDEQGAYTPEARRIYGEDEE